MGLAISPETVWEGAPRKGSNKNAAVARPRHRNNRLCILLTMAETLDVSETVYRKWFLR